MSRETLSENARRAIWDEAHRRAVEEGGDPEECFRAIMQEAFDSLVASGEFVCSGLNERASRMAG
jgi:hypothetical protein